MTNPIEKQRSDDRDLIKKSLEICLSLDSLKKKESLG